MKIACGSISIDGLDKDEILEGIVAYDQAERNEAYIGQVNMIAVSSFSGPMSAIWGLDMAKVDPKVLRPDVPLFTIDGVPVYSMEPLIYATEALFGTADKAKRKFPVIPGGHLPTAVKSHDSIDPNTGKPTSGWVWSYLALAIAKKRGEDSSLFVEDAGFFPDTYSYGTVESMTAAQVEDVLRKKARAVAYSQILCGRNQSAEYGEIFIVWRKQYIPKGYYGTAITCAPYVILAQKAYPNGVQDPQALIDISLEDWIKNTPGAKTRSKN